jgi:riboflavin kinase / FMN adenylyltransferase
MRSFQGLKAITPDLFRTPVALTLGVFDGVHLGHQSLLAELKEWAAEDGGEAVVLTFDKHPMVTLTGQGPPTLTSLPHKLAYLDHYGAESVVILPFDKAWARCSAERFLELIVTHIRPARILLGSNHHFGEGRRGDIKMACAHADRHGYKAREFSLKIDDEPISSTRVRNALSAGYLEDVESLLGRKFSIFGVTIEGEQRGRTIGFPTANLRLCQLALPPMGVYAASTHLQDGSDHLSLVNIGQRPTFKDNGALLVEVHLLDFSGDLYGQELEVELLSSIRKEKRFDSLEALKLQIAADRRQAMEKHGLKKA